MLTNTISTVEAHACFEVFLEKSKEAFGGVGLDDTTSFQEMFQSVLVELNNEKHVPSMLADTMTSWRT